MGLAGPLFLSCCQIKHSQNQQLTMLHLQRGKPSTPLLIDQEDSDSIPVEFSGSLSGLGPPTTAAIKRSRKLQIWKNATFSAIYPYTTLIVLMTCITSTNAVVWGTVVHWLLTFGCSQFWWVVFCNGIAWQWLLIAYKLPYVFWFDNRSAINSLKGYKSIQH